MTDRGKPQGETMDECLTRLSDEIDRLHRERARFAAILEAFRRAPLSVSSVQPLLALADELNGVMR